MAFNALLSPYKELISKMEQMCVSDTQLERLARVVSTKFTEVPQTLEENGIDPKKDENF